MITVKKLYEWNTPLSESPEDVQLILRGLKEEYVSKLNGVWSLKKPVPIDIEYGPVVGDDILINDRPAKRFSDFAGYVYISDVTYAVTDEGVFDTAGNPVSYSNRYLSIPVGVAFYTDLRRILRGTANEKITKLFRFECLEPAVTGSRLRQERYRFSCIYRGDMIGTIYKQGDGYVFITDKGKSYKAVYDYGRYIIGDRCCFYWDQGLQFRSYVYCG